MTKSLVVDASALLAVLLLEPGGQSAGARLEGSLMSVVSLAEVLTRLERVGLDPVGPWEAVRRLGIDFISADQPLAFRAAHLHSQTRNRGLSLGDCFCLALAQERGAEVLTADRAWRSLRIGVPITLVRQ